MPSVKKILLVCTGNSCRSVMAEGFLKKALEGRADYQITSAGISAVNGMRPTAETIRVMAEEGIDVSGHRSAFLTEEMLRDADLILVMERMHRENILRRMPVFSGKAHLLAEYGRVGNEDTLVDPDIPDPIGGSQDYYREVFAIIRESLLRVIRRITEEE